MKRSKKAAAAMRRTVRAARRAKAEKKAPAKCRCREPRRHADCMYCGSSYAGEVVCGVCREAGIDGKLIRGTGRVVCALHKALSGGEEAANG